MPQTPAADSWERSSPRAKSLARPRTLTAHAQLQRLGAQLAGVRRIATVYAGDEIAGASRPTWPAARRSAGVVGELRAAARRPFAATAPAASARPRRRTGLQELLYAMYGLHHRGPVGRVADVHGRCWLPAGLIGGSTWPPQNRRPRRCTMATAQPPKPAPVMRAPQQPGGPGPPRPSRSMRRWKPRSRRAG